MISWIILFIAGLCEVIWAVALKYSHGFSRPFPSAVAILFTIVSFLLLSFAMRKLPMGTAYAVWTGIGVVGTFIFGAFVLREPMGIAQGVCVLLILLGIIGLKVLS